MHHHGGTAQSLFWVANLIIAAGYLSVPLLVLPYLPTTLATKVAGAVFFAGCMGTHLWMAFGHQHTANWWWALEHAIQAAATWAFILLFRRNLQAAHALRRRNRADAGAGP